MSSELADQIAGQRNPLEWIDGRVTAVTGDTLSMTYSGGVVTRVGYISGYVPAVNDYVQALMGPQGIMVFGARNPGTPPTPPSVPASVIVNASSYATHASLNNVWTPSTANQVRGVSEAVWLYTPASFSALSRSILRKFEIELTRTSGGPPEFVQHYNTAATGPLVVDPQRYSAGPNPPIGAPTWVPLPLGWGTAIIARTIKGIAIQSDLYSSAWSGTGRLRFSAMAPPAP
jgi:hypothetical protein